MTREELKAALRAAADDYKRATDEAVAAYGRGYDASDPDWQDYEQPLTRLDLGDAS